MPYSGDPADSDTDAVRFLVGDTAASPVLADEEVDFLVADSTDVYLAAARAAESLATEYMGEVDRSMGGLSISIGSKADKYTALAKSLRVEAAKGGGAPIFTAESVSGKDTIEDDDDRVASRGFTIGMHDFTNYDPNTGDWY